MSSKRKSFLSAFLILTFSFFLFVSLAQVSLAQQSDLILKLQQPFGELAREMKITSESIGEYIRAIYVFGSAAIIIFAIVAVMFGGIQWLTAGGNPQGISNAKNTIIKAMLGLFIAIFAVYLLETISPYTVTFKPIDVEVIKPIICCQINSGYKILEKEECTQQKGTEADMVNCQTGTVCDRDGEVQCGQTYDGECIGKKCDDKTLTCIQLNGNSYKCDKCLPENSVCNADSECCTGHCEGAETGGIGTCKQGAFGQHCTASKPCPPGFICETNWRNRCTKGGVGVSCSKDSECATGVCFMPFWRSNRCSARVSWARCINDSQCPADHTCKDQFRYCNPTYPTYLQPYTDYKCKTYPSWADVTGVKMCIPNDVKCVCDCSNNTDCKDVTYNGTPAPYCYTGGYNYCSAGTLATLCNKNSDCVSGYCNTNGSNMCTQGQVGEGCDKDNQCSTGRCHEQHCVPYDFSG
ncbi:MAG TPA: hypothetical protein ENN28_04090 [Candidatus Uhrbacteria bacterium]|nr:hypothetical protein [Candidatus Uhrbacteria bacterium]